MVRVRSKWMVDGSKTWFKRNIIIIFERVKSKDGYMVEKNPFFSPPAALSVDIDDGWMVEKKLHSQLPAAGSVNVDCQQR
jgi:hypothetical protein